MPLTLDDLRAASLARQLPAQPPAGPTDLLTTVGPIQSQTARSTFLGLAARSRGLRHAEISAAFEQHHMLRGSTIRGTVHTMTPHDQQVLDAVTRAAQRTMSERMLPLQSLTLEDVWAGLEAYAWKEWRSADALRDRLREILQSSQEADDALESASGRYLAVCHGGLLRRPLNGGWDRQGRPGYRAAEAVTGLARLPQDAAISRAVLLHLRRHGPSSRRDIAWWSGLGLRVVDAAVSGLADRISRQDGPDGQVYLDVADTPAPREAEGVALLRSSMRCCAGTTHVLEADSSPLSTMNGSGTRPMG